MSYAAYRSCCGGTRRCPTSRPPPSELDAVMADRSATAPTTNRPTATTPLALGNRIAEAVIEFGSTDGALEDERYVDSSYRPANDPMVVERSGHGDEVIRTPGSRSRSVYRLAQNGLPIPGNVQTYIGPQWGYVTSFALPSSPTGTPIDPGPPPRLGDPATDDEFKQAAVDVIRVQLANSTRPTASKSTSVRRRRATTPWDANDGSGHDENPVTGEPYAPDAALQCRPLAGDRRVLGRRADVGDTTGPLEPDRERRGSTPPASSAGSVARVRRWIRWSGTSRPTSR